MSLSCCNDRYIQFVCPSAKLFYGCCTERISCTKDDTVSHLFVSVCKFGNSGCFSCAVYSDDHFNKRFGITLFPICFILKYRDQGVKCLYAVDVVWQIFQKSLYKFIVNICFKQDIFKILFRDLFFLCGCNFFNGLVGLA